MAERVEIRAKRWKLWLFLAGTLAFGAVGLAQIVLQPPGAGWSWTSVLFFGVLGTPAFARQLRAKRAPLAFDADGIAEILDEIRRVTDGRVAVLEVNESRTYSRTPALLLQTGANDGRREKGHTSRRDDEGGDERAREAVDCGP